MRGSGFESLGVGGGKQEWCFLEERIHRQDINLSRKFMVQGPSFPWWEKKRERKHDRWWKKSCVAKICKYGHDIYKLRFTLRRRLRGYMHLLFLPSKSRWGLQSYMHLLFSPTKSKEQSNMHLLFSRLSQKNGQSYFNIILWIWSKFPQLKLLSKLK